jgi:uncharacterized protein (DUF2267 family)
MACRVTHDMIKWGMPMPFTYQSATNDFEAFLDNLLTISGLTTRNQAYTMTRAVFIVFRSHVAPQVALDFAQSLPAVLRAIFIENWKLAGPVLPFPDRETLTHEVLSIREAHNFSTPNAIAEVSAALRRAMKPEDWERAIDSLPAAARHFWTGH